MKNKEDKQPNESLKSNIEFKRDISKPIRIINNIESVIVIVIVVVIVVGLILIYTLN